MRNMPVVIIVNIIILSNVFTEVKMLSGSWRRTKSQPKSGKFLYFLR